MREERHEHQRAKQREALRQAKHLFQSLLYRASTDGIRLHAQHRAPLKKAP